jgi:hypothetical protein
MVRVGISRAICLLAIFVAACGGADPVTDAPAVRAQAPQRALALDATALMDWAEGHYSRFFPSHPANGTISIGTDNYVYRAYGNNTYLGVTDGGAVDVLLPDVFGQGVHHVGTLADFTCQVYDCSAAVTGTAAAGAPIAGVTVTLKDSTNHAVTATTSVTGAYSLSTTGLTGPFLLQLTTPGGSLFSATADAGSAIVANLTPLTDLIVRSWYSVQGVSADTAFANPAVAPPPTQQQARSVAEVVLSVMQLALNSSNSGISAPLDLINKPFAADHTGLDDVLDKTRITYSASATATATVTVSGTSTQQTSVIGYDAAQGSITAASTTSGGGNTSTSSISAVVPVSSPQATASNEIEAALSNFASVVNAQGTALAKADLLPLLDPDLLDDGLNRDQFAADMVSNFHQGQALNVQLRRINSLDIATGQAEMSVLVIESLGSQSASENMTFNFRKVANVWTFSGNQRIARISIDAEARINQGGFNQDSGPSINVDVRPLQGTVSGVAVTTAAGSIAVTKSGVTTVDESGVFMDSFFGNTGPLPAGFLPAAGTPFNITMTRPGSTAVTMTIPLNAFTTEGVPIISPTGSTLADAHLGGTLDVSWRLPSTYAVAHVNLAALVFTGSQSTATFQCESPEVVLGVTATSGTLSIPAICNGLPVVNVNINLSITGINGERSQTIYFLH